MPNVYLLPDAEGSVQQWSVFPLGLVHWDKVDDPIGSPDEDSTYVWTNVMNEIEDFNHETSVVLTGATITNVRVVVRAKATTMFLTTINIGIRIGLVRYAGTDWSLATWYTLLPWDWAKKPPFNQDWTKADIDNLQSSIKMMTDSVIARVTQVYLIVTYTLPPTVAGKGLVSWTP